MPDVGGFLHHFWIGVAGDPGTDKEKAGRVPVRIHGRHDDTQLIPDSTLPMAMPAHSVKSAGHNQMGNTPVGIVKGSTVFGFFLDPAQQIPIMLGTIAKSGNPVAGQTTNGQLAIDPATNSNPTGGRSANNSFITRQGKNIKNDDTGSGLPKETTDKDAVNIVKDVVDKAKFAALPTLASIPAVKNVLQSLQSVDPKNLSASLPNAVNALIKLKQLMGIASPNGNISVTGSAVAGGISQAASSTSMEYIIVALANALNATDISPTTQQVIYQALIQLENQYSYTPDVQTIVQTTGSQFATDLLNLINSGTLNSTTLEALIQKYISNMNDATTSNALGGGVTQANILSMIGPLIPILGPLVQKTVQEHLPTSVLNQDVVKQALQKFSKNQAMIKLPDNGKKALALLAVTPGASLLNSNMLNIVNNLKLNVSPAALTQIQNQIGNLFK